MAQTNAQYTHTLEIMMRAVLTFHFPLLASAPTPNAHLYRG